MSVCPCRCSGGMMSFVMRRKSQRITTIVTLTKRKCPTVRQYNCFLQETR